MGTVVRHREEQSSTHRLSICICKAELEPFLLASTGPERANGDLYQGSLRTAKRGLFSPFKGEGPGVFQLPAVLEIGVLLPSACSLIS